jgi:hypothetical protein
MFIFKVNIYFLSGLVVGAGWGVGCTGFGGS